VFEAGELLLAFGVFFVFSAVTAGATVCTGVVIPAMFMGALVGRLSGQLINSILGYGDPAMCATVGAACFFSAISRKSLSVVLIMLEVSGAPTHVQNVVMGTIISKAHTHHTCM
jgi:chloride channel 7